MKIEFENFHICFFGVYIRNYSVGQIRYKIILTDKRGDFI